jgi:hypothetical protein
MVSTGKCLLVAVLSTALIVAPIHATTKPFGVVVQADRARLGTAEASTGSTVFSGDTLTTNASGLLRVRTARGQLYLLENSEARLESRTDGTAVQLVRGTVGLQMENESFAGIYALGALVRPKTGGAHVQVSISKLNELVVASASGAAEVVLLNRTLEVPAGTAYRLAVAPAALQGGVGAGSGISANLVATWIVIGAIIGGIILATIFLEQTDRRPSPFSP